MRAVGASLKRYKTMLKISEICDFDDIYTLMETSFPPDERRKCEGQAALFDDEKYRIYTVKDDGGKRVLGFFAIWEFEKWLYIEHFAVSPTQRGKGLGSRMLAELTAMTDKKICLEVELPENEIAERRISFYERNGFKLNRYEYVQPAMEEGKKAVPLYIMTYGGGINETEFNDIRGKLYRYVYKVI